MQKGFKLFKGMVQLKWQIYLPLCHSKLKSFSSVEQKRRVFAEVYGRFPVKVNGDWGYQASIMTKISIIKVVCKTCAQYIKSSEAIQYLCVKNRPKHESLLIENLCLHTIKFNDI